MKQSSEGLQVQSLQQASNNIGVLNTCTRLWLTESEQVTPVDSIKDVVRKQTVLIRKKILLINEI